MSAWPDWLKVIQLKPRFLFALWLLGALVLCFPVKLAGMFGITELRDQFRPWIGVATLAAFAFWLVQLLPILQDRRQRKRLRQEALAALDTLSGDEWLLMAYCLERNQRTVCIEMIDKAARALCQKGLLVMGTGVGNQLSWPFTIPQFVWDHLQVNRASFLPNPLPPEIRQQLQILDDHIHRYDRGLWF